MIRTHTFTAWFQMARQESSIYYFWKSGAGRFPPLMLDSIDDFRQTSANAVDGEVRKERKDLTQSPTVDDHTLKIKLFSISLYLRSRSVRSQRVTQLPVFLVVLRCIFPTLKNANQSVPQINMNRQNRSCMNQCSKTLAFIQQPIFYHLYLFLLYL